MEQASLTVQGNAVVGFDDAYSRENQQEEIHLRREVYKGRGVETNGRRKRESIQLLGLAAGCGTSGGGWSATRLAMHALA
ncbi:hypothetical protein E5D57_001256 [Metarhizium anisopliae]|nr:hypothetical protein E5D57_001256 [Metarhizium anisopliae]